MWQMWQHDQLLLNPNPRVLQIEKVENKSKENKNEKENKKKLSPLFAILTIRLSVTTSFIDYYLRNN